MAVKLNERGYQHARKIVEDRQYVLDDRDEWAERHDVAQVDASSIGDLGDMALLLSEAQPPRQRSGCMITLVQPRSRLSKCS
ncbi:hypothetical protein GCM10007977_088150 [Dactylosporangium sucinum]|uniref:Uncharacterized protein n=1 Tax=Dactylosporangium sucinum TaxID=1424081 RepID=A0A917UB05_9ACTN|nr:hypothetical protein GCM10007977_088150 [Dactylosporangium sucinum]